MSNSYIYSDIPRFYENQTSGRCNSRQTLRSLPRLSLVFLLSSPQTSGVLHVFSIKKGAIETAYKSLPNGQAISCVTHGLGESQRDKIFIAVGRTVQVRERETG